MTLKGLQRSDGLVDRRVLVSENPPGVDVHPLADHRLWRWRLKTPPISSSIHLKDLEAFPS